MGRVAYIALAKPPKRAPGDPDRYTCPHCVSSRIVGTCCRCKGTRTIDWFAMLAHGPHTWGYQGCACDACSAAKRQLAHVTS